MVTGEYLQFSKRVNEEKNRKELERIFFEKKEKFFHIALRYVKNSDLAWECVQESFKNALKGLKNFENKSKLETWIVRILINVSLQKIKRENLNRESMDINDINAASRGDDPFTYSYKRELKEIILSALNKLKEIHRNIIIEHDLCGVPLNEIAKKYGLSVGTAKSRLFYGRRELKAKLKSVNIY